MKKIVFILLIGVTLTVASCVEKSGDQKTAESEFIEVVADVEFKDFGPAPLVINIEDYTIANETFRTAIWTGNSLQLTVMSIPPGEDIGEEMHSDIDQFLRVESGSGIIKMGNEEGSYDFEERVKDDYAIFIPAGKWHNLINDSDEPLKVYSIYGPAEHPHSTIHSDREESIAAHEAEENS